MSRLIDVDIRSLVAVLACFSFRHLVRAHLKKLPLGDTSGDIVDNHISSSILSTLTFWLFILYQNVMDMLYDDLAWEQSDN